MILLCFEYQFNYMSEKSNTKKQKVATYMISRPFDQPKVSTSCSHQLLYVAVAVAVFMIHKSNGKKLVV